MDAALDGWPILMISPSLSPVLYDLAREAARYPFGNSRASSIGCFWKALKSEGQAEPEQRIIFLDCGDALVWLNGDAGRCSDIPAFRRESGLSFARRCLVSKAREMTELEALARNIDGLTELLRVAWRDLANPLLTTFERREARNQIDLYSAELRRHLQLKEAERCRSRNQSLEQRDGRSSGKPKPRLLPDR